MNEAATTSRRAVLAEAFGMEASEFYGDDAVQAVLDAIDHAKDLRIQRDGFREWLRLKESRGGTVVRIAEVREFFGWPA